MPRALRHCIERMFYALSWWSTLCTYLNKSVAMLDRCLVERTRHWSCCCGCYRCCRLLVMHHCCCGCGLVNGCCFENLGVVQLVVEVVESGALGFGDVVAAFASAVMESLG
jgi:hypothetical protein